METPLLQTEALTKSFPTAGEGEGDGEVEILCGVDLELLAGERVSIVGQSGSGKSTLLHVLGTLEHPTSGRVLIEGEDVFAKDEADLARLRNRSIGFVFQAHHLLPEFTALENVMMPGLLRGIAPKEMRERAAGVLDEVELSHRLDYRVGKLSGGERQRVAVARALVLDPPILLADEPTGNLDPGTGERVGELLLRLNEQRGAALVVVTHNEGLAQRIGTTVTLADGVLVPASP
ncbi:MAG: ABC transporter ATP-binding protein [Myxococcota bacterium]|nr:ABC transporter ATP-binding protein [Myxococcota bacterium]